MRILLSNDDGIGSDGLKALHEVLAPFAEVWVVAPDREQSAKSHSITLHRPLRIKPLKQKERWLSVDGTPTDCVYLALNHVLKDRRPDLVCSGVNHGANVGDDVIYSGTVAAAMEAALLGVPSIAFSLVGAEYDFGPCVDFAAKLARMVAKNALPRSSLLNVNFPSRPFSGYAVTHLGKRTYGNAVVEGTDPRGRKFYWIGGNEAQHDDIPGSDCNAVFDQGLVSVTPVNLDFTDHPLLQTVGGWQVPGYDRKG